jgi:uncharacterized membrane protein
VVTAAGTISQVAMHMAVSFGVLYVLTGSFVAGGAAAVLEPICNVILMPFHDKFWEKVGKKVEARGKQPAGASGAGQTAVMQA